LVVFPSMNVVRCSDLLHEQPRHVYQYWRVTSEHHGMVPAHHGMAPAHHGMVPVMCVHLHRRFSTFTNGLVRTNVFCKAALPCPGLSSISCLVRPPDLRMDDNQGTPNDN
jgi:hypothetical protein